MREAHQMMIRVTSQAEVLPSGRRLTRLLLLFYCIFILYGSFIPFNFTAHPRRVGERLSRALIIPYQGGAKNFSVPDVASNVLLFIPFGALGVSLLLVGPGARRPWQSVAVTGGLGLVFKDFTFDYAFSAIGELGFTHHFGIALRWGDALW